MFRPPGHLFLFLLLLTFPVLARPAAAAVGRWTSLGPDGGTVQALAADPARPGRLYAGTDGGGVWRSTDGGVSWIWAGSGLASPDIFALDVAPDAPGTVWAATRGGIYKTADGGFSWQRVWSEAETVSVSVDPTDPGVAWAGTARGWVLKTTDGGASWETVLDLLGHPVELLLDPAAPDTVYAFGRDGLHKTTDGGATWTRLREEQVEALTLDPSDPRILYSSGNLYGVWKSSDGGATWSPLSDLDESFVQNLLVDPSDPSVVFAATSGWFWRSGDAGTTWQRVAGLPLVSVLALEADSSRPGRIWLGSNERAVFRSLDFGRTWRVTRQGLTAPHLFAAAFDPLRPRTLYTVAVSTGVHRTTNGGRTWSRVNAGLPSSPGYGVLVNTVAVHPSRPGTLFAGTGGGIWRSTDLGAHWSRVLNHGDVNALVFHPRRPGTIFSGGDSLFRSRNDGRTWKRLILPGTPYESEIAGLFISPLRPESVFVLDINQRNRTTQSLFRSADGGNTWTTVFTGGPTALAAHPVTPGLLYLATEDGGEIWTSADDGITWDQVAAGAGGGARLTALLVDRIDPSILYLGTDGTGVWRSRDRGATWEPFAAGLIAPRITCLEPDPWNPRRITACTWGGGLQEIRVSSNS
jgi:photosystem II stability/assembly factor-like uncharacterized protein